MARDQHRDVPIDTIGHARHGDLVRVVGKVVSCEDELLVAPISGRECVCFDAAVKDIEVDENGRIRSSTIAYRSLRGRPFLIEDGTGEAHVDPRGAFVELRLDHHQTGWLPRTALPEIVAGVQVDENTAYIEGVLVIGDEVEVSGVFRRADQAGPYRGRSDGRAMVLRTNSWPLSIVKRRTPA